MNVSLEQNMQRYADIIVQVGLNLQSGQKLAIRAPIETAPLVRLVAARAYQAGARFVDVTYDDDQVTLARFQFAPRDSFEEDRVWLGPMLEEHGRNGNATLTIKAEDPDLLQNQDSELVSRLANTVLKNRKAIRELISHGAINWCVVGASAAGWASKIFPDLAPAEREERLWQSIFEVCRINQDDPLEAWRRHNQQLEARCNYLNQKQYSALKYSAPGTNLSVGLPQGHVWCGDLVGLD